LHCNHATTDVFKQRPALLQSDANPSGTRRDKRKSPGLLDADRAAPAAEHAPILLKMQTPDPRADSSYDLVFRAGANPRFSLRGYQGVTLTAERIAWSCDGKDDGAPFANIRMVNLYGSGDPNFAPRTYTPHKVPDEMLR
jgi:hypothetical protein